MASPENGAEGFDLQPDVQAAILWGAEQLKVNPNDLAATIGYETAGSFRPSVENEAARRKGKKGAVGFIQFTPSVGIPGLNEFLQTPKGRQCARTLGITATSVTRDSLLNMAPLEQMRFVVLYFRIPVNALPEHATYDKIYQKILAPGRNSDIWYREGDGNYEANSQFDTNKDGQITRLEAAGEIRKQGFVVNYFQPVTDASAQSAPAPRKPSPQGPSAAPPKPAAQTQAAAPKTPVPTTVNPQMGDKASFDDRVTQVLTAFTQAYHFPVTVRWQDPQGTHENSIQVQTPYFINSGSIQVSIRKNRANMSAADRAVFQQAPATARLGKASPEQMQAFAQLLVQANPFGVPPGSITGALVTGWLKKYGIGVDCSGFVSQALDTATTQLTGQDPHIGDPNVRVNRASGSLHGNNQEFEKVGTPAEVRPGDTMWLSGHIRIVLRVGPGPGGKGIQMMIAESTPNAQLPVARAQGTTTLTGVDRAIWWFADATKFTRRGLKKKTESYNWDALPTDKWETANTADIESFYFSRYRPLDRGRR
ncbi:hypothetical protein [Deinococcus multiflagellatus]|uniref:NlpC/P60 domain-containing protein n=1 Tax=Deinococcus multiflagellatus TaxID=1656887 RepID=A0ABW1ZKW0_9DEIO